MNKKKMNGKFIGLFACLVMLLAVSGICIWNVTNQDKYDTAMLVEEKQTLNEDQMVELTRKTVLVCANDEFDASNSNAVETSQSGNIWSLTYDSTKAAEEAYEMYSNDENVVFCEYDTTLKTQTLDETDTDESNSDITKDSLVESHLEHTDSPEIYENILSSLDDETYEKTEKAVIVVIDSGATGSYENAYNAFDGSNDVTDTVGHGTQMISTITDMLSDYNGSYEIVPVKVANENGVGSITALIRAFEYASDLNATVVNLSLTSLDNADSYILEEYIAKLGHNGTVVVTSAGNFSDDTSNYVPAKFEDAIVVGSCDENGELASFSNYGTSVDWLVDSDSTSEAAAIMSSLYAKAYLDDVHPLEIMSESDVVYSYVYDAIPDEGQDVNHVSLYDETAYASSDLNLDRFVDKELWWCANYSCTCDEDSYTQYSCGDGCVSMNATITVKNTYGSTTGVSVKAEADSATGKPLAVYTITQTGTQKFPVGYYNPEEKHTARHGSVEFSNRGNDTIIKFINCDVASLTTFIFITPDVRPGYTVSSIVPTGEASDYYTHYCKSGNKATGGWHAGYVDYRNGGYYSYAGALNKTNEYTISYTANNYSVAYNANGGTGSMSNSSHTYGTAKNLTANSFVRTGYTFAGWNTKSDGTGTAYADKASVKNLTTTNGGTVTLYANWTPNTYTIAYNSNKPSSASHDITGSTSSSSHVYDTAKALTSNGYKLTGWMFAGWNTKADGSGTAYANKASVKNLTTANGATVVLYAQWTANKYTVVYDINKPSNASHDVTGTMANSAYTYDKSSTLRSNTYALVGWTFTGWNTKADGSGTSYADKAKVLNWTATDGATITLYAQWKANTYSVKYDKNKPSTASSNVAGSMANTIHTYDTASALRTNTYALVGWTFTGWNTKADGSGTAYTDKASVSTLSSTEGATVTLYAQWRQNTYTVVYDKNRPTVATHGIQASNTVTGSMANTSHTYDKNTALRTNVYKLTGWTFKEWNTKADGSGTTVTTGLNLTPVDKGTVTLYAIWTPNQYLIRFLQNDGGTGVVDGEMASMTATYDVPMNLTLNSYVKTTPGGIEYRDGEVVTKKSLFKGWNRESDVFTATFADGATVLNLESEQGAIVNLYAIWDDTPSFTIGEYPDRYFTLREAQNGEITEEELLSTIVVYDRETNPLVKKTSADVAHTGNDVGLTIVGYQASDFTSLTGDTKISVRYQLKDESYLTAYLNITVSVNEMDPTVEPIVNYTRSMSEDYYQDDAGSYVMADVGGLNEKSRWITDTYYSSLLTKALQSVEEIPESELVFKQSFSSEDMQNMRNYVNTNGFGNSENPNGLQNFYNLLIN